MTAWARIARPSSAPARKRNSVVWLGSAWFPRRRCVASSLKGETVGEEIPVGQLELNEGAVAFVARVAAGADGAQVVPVDHLDKSEAIQQLAEQCDARDSGNAVLGRFDDDRGDAAQGPGNDPVLDLGPGAAVFSGQVLRSWLWCER